VDAVAVEMQNGRRSRISTTHIAPSNPNRRSRCSLMTRAMERGRTESEVRSVVTREIVSWVEASKKANGKSNQLQRPGRDVHRRVAIQGCYFIRPIHLRKAR
jgi:hypothetical protein